MGIFFLLLFIISAIIFFFWQKILDFFLAFLPEKVDVNGEVIDVFTKPGFYPFFVSVDNSLIAFDVSKGIPVDLYYIKVQDPQKNEFYTIEVDFLMYTDMRKKFDFNLDVTVSLSCKKSKWNGELYV